MRSPRHARLPIRPCGPHASAAEPALHIEAANRPESWGLHCDSMRRPDANSTKLMLPTVCGDPPRGQ